MCINIPQVSHRQRLNFRLLPAVGTGKPAFEPAHLRYEFWAKEPKGDRVPCWAAPNGVFVAAGTVT